MTRVTELQQELAAAEAEAAKQKREDAKKEIQRLRREGAKLLAELRPMARQVKDAQQTRLNLHGLLVQARNAILELSSPVDPLDFDADVRARAEQLQLWRERQKELLALSRAAIERESIRSKAVALQNQINNLRFEISNQSVVAEGRKLGELGSPMTTVSEDFLGSTGMPPRHST